MVGFKKLHAVIEGSDFVLYKSEKMTEKDEFLRVNL